MFVNKTAVDALLGWVKSTVAAFKAVVVSLHRCHSLSILSLFACCSRAETAPDSISVDNWCVNVHLSPDVFFFVCLFEFGFGLLLLF